MPPDNLIFQIATWLIPLVIAIVFHEISHGWVANAFGDPTARDLGRLSPNPIRHVDPIGTVALPLVLAVAGAPVFGWAKPVPVVAARMRNPRLHMMIVALAGPGMNFALALLAAIGLPLIVPSVQAGSQVSRFVAENLENFLLINVFLAVFNLLPIPPFDGGHVVEGLLPRGAARRYRKLGRYGFPLLVILLVVLPMLSPRANVVAHLVVPPARGIAGFLLGLVGLG
ncbi:site-2 protease family protein [Sphingosinicella sp. BN140058]|uniref:site-2 protease family protein n=1 Tax=Sphingosinicella sp. BN140058 TaxID=1892855 RepID=UPI0010124641|nr:site-2 protease family protein [Sphingosinicella sp. BN140058]QAY76793.1 site-2 protease family protein [Sphingosinicella sp. BN140058]